MANRRYLTALTASVLTGLALAACAESPAPHDGARPAGEAAGNRSEAAAGVDADIAADDVVACRHFARFAEAGAAGEASDAFAALEESIRVADSPELRALFADFKGLVVSRDLEAAEDVAADLGLRCAEILASSGVDPDDL